MDVSNPEFTVENATIPEVTVENATIPKVTVENAPIPEFTVKNATTPENVQYILTYFDNLIPTELNMGFNRYVISIGNFLRLSEKLPRDPIENSGQLFANIKWAEIRGSDIVPAMSHEQVKNIVFSNLREMKNDPSQKEDLERIKLILTTYSKILPKISELQNKINDFYRQSSVHAKKSWTSSTKYRRNERNTDIGTLTRYMKELIKLEPNFNESIDEIYGEIFPNVGFRPDKAALLELANDDGKSRLPAHLLINEIAPFLGGGRMYKKRRLTKKGSKKRKSLKKKRKTMKKKSKKSKNQKNRRTTKKQNMH